MARRCTNCSSSAMSFSFRKSKFLMNIAGDQRVPLAAGTPVNVASTAGAGPKDDEDTYDAQGRGIPLV